MFILQSLASSFISIIREREKARETEKCVMLLTVKIRQPVWWHSYSKIMVCLLLWNISLTYGQDPNIHNLACTQGAVAVIIARHNYQKTIYISNISTNKVLVITEEVGHISCLPSCILSCRARCVVKRCCTHYWTGFWLLKPKHVWSSLI